MGVGISATALEDASIAIFSLGAAEIMRERGSEVNCRSVLTSAMVIRSGVDLALAWHFKLWQAESIRTKIACGIPLAAINHGGD